METTGYLHKLPVCGWGAHLGHHVPEELTMKYWHVQEQTRTCCCSVCASRTKGVFRSAMIRYEAAIDPTLFASEVNFSSSTIEVMPQGTTTRADRETPTPDTQVRSNCDAALRACRCILIQAAPTSGIAARCCILR